MIRYIGVDPGAHTGIVVMTQDGQIEDVREVVKGHVVRPLAARGSRPARGGITLWQTWAAHCYSVLAELRAILEPGDVLVYEDVRRHQGTDAAHAYGRLLAVLEMAAYDRDCTLAPVGVGKIKLCATRHGRAEKDDMIAAAEARWGPAWQFSEHTADAAWIAETFRRGEE